MTKFRIVGNKKTGFAVVHSTGGIEYDLLETREEATALQRQARLEGNIGALEWVLRANE